MRAGRLLEILLLLQKGRMTAGELAQRLEVSERTIYRDMDALSAAGVPVYAERGPQGGWRLAGDWETTVSGLTEDEVQALYLVGLSGALKELGWAPALERALLKLGSLLPRTVRQSAESYRERIHLDASPWFGSTHTLTYLPLVQEALWQNLRLRILYQDRTGSVRERLFEPYGLVAKAGTWYVAGRSNGNLRVYRVSRIQQAEKTGDSFERPPDFHLASFWAEWLRAFEASLPHYNATIHIHPEEAERLPPFVIARFPSIRNAPDEAGGAGSIRLRLTFDSFEDALHWLLGLGPLVRVEEPEELRRAIREAATGILDR